MTAVGKDHDKADTCEFISILEGSKHDTNP